MWVYMSPLTHAIDLLPLKSVCPGPRWELPTKMDFVCFRKDCKRTLCLCHLLRSPSISLSLCRQSWLKTISRTYSTQRWEHAPAPTLNSSAFTFRQLLMCAKRSKRWRAADESNNTQIPIKQKESGGIENRDVNGTHLWISSSSKTVIKVFDLNFGTFCWCPFRLVVRNEPRTLLYDDGPRRYSRIAYAWRYSVVHRSFSSPISICCSSPRVSPDNPSQSSYISSHRFAASRTGTELCVSHGLDYPLTIIAENWIMTEHFNVNIELYSWS